MKKLLIIIFVFCSAISFGQSLTSQFTAGKKRVSDSIAFYPTSAGHTIDKITTAGCWWNLWDYTRNVYDTILGNYYTQTQVTNLVNARVLTADSNLTKSGGYATVPYVLAHAGTTDTTSLSNRINLKLNISDTLNMLSGYQRKGDSATYQTKYRSDTGRTNTLAYIATKMSNPMTAAGDMIYDSTGNKTTNLPIGNNGEILTVVNGLPNWMAIPVTGYYVYFFTPTASAVAGNYQMQQTAYSPTTAMATQTVTADGQVLYNYITEPNYPNLTTIPAGVFQVNTHAVKSSGSQACYVYAEVWETNSAGVNIAMIAQTGYSSILTNASQDLYETYQTYLPYNLASAASRVRVIVKAHVVGGGSNPNVYVSVGGATDSRLIMPAPIMDVTNFVPYTGATKSLTMTGYNVTADTFKTGKVSWGNLYGTPTTLSGYGITDGLSTTLATGKMWVGNGGNIASAVTPSGDWTISNTGLATLKNTGTAGTYGGSTAIPVITTDAQGRVTSITTTTVTAGTGTVTSVTSANSDAAVATPTTTPVITIVAAPKLSTARTINGTSFDGTTNITVPNTTTLSDVGTGDVTWSTSGTQNLTKTTTLATVNSNVGSFTYGSFTVNAKGLITAASSGSAPTGTVTAVSIATANGFAGSSSGGATPALTMSVTPTSGSILKSTTGGAITAAVAGTDYQAAGSYQTQLNGTGFVKATGTTISYDNSTYLTANQTTTVTTTGDATGTASGTTNISVPLTLATVNSNVGNFGGATTTTTVTVNAKGLVTAVGTVTPTPAIANVTGLGTGVATLLAATPSGTTSLAGTASPTFTGTPIAPTPTAGTNTGAIATASFVTTALVAYTTQTVTTTSYTTSVTPTSSAASPMSSVIYTMTAQSGALLFNNPSGSWADGQQFYIRVKPTGSGAALTYGTKYRGTNPALPTATVLSQTLYMQFIYNLTEDKYDLSGFFFAY